LRAKLKFGVEVRPSFSVSQKKDKNRINVALLSNFINFFDCGFIRESKHDGTLKYEVRDLKELNLKIIPFFKTHNLQTAKQQDFEVFVIICNLLKQGLHLNKHGLINILDLVFSMNPNGKQKYNKELLLKVIDKLKV